MAVVEISVDGKPVVGWDSEKKEDSDIQLQGSDWHPGNILFHVRPEDRQAVRQERQFMNDAYDAAMHACLSSAIRTMNNTGSSQSGGYKASGNFKSQYPLVIPRGTYKSNRPLVKPPGIEVEGGRSMEAVTIRQQTGDGTRQFIQGEYVDVGFDILGGIVIAGQEIKAHTMGISGLRVTSSSEKNPVAGYVLRGHHTNPRFSHIAFLGPVDDKGFGFLHVNQYPDVQHKFEREGYNPIIVETIKQSAVALDMWMESHQIERAGIGVLVRGSLGLKLIGSIYYCQNAVVLPGAYYANTRNFIADRWNGQPKLGTTRLGVYVAGNGNVIEDNVQNAADAALVYKGWSNSVRLKDPRGAGRYRCIKPKKEGQKQERGMGDVFPLKRKRGGGYEEGSFGRWQSGDMGWGGGVDVFKRLLNQEKEEGQ
jgi:hypothetical protein